MTTLSFDVLWRDRGAAKGLSDLGSRADQAHGKLSKFSGMAGKGFKAVGVAAVGMAAAGSAALLGAGAAATAFAVKSVKMAGDFESSMRQVGVTTGVGKKGLKDLTAVAIDMGAKTSFSAQGASEAMLALAKGGMSAAQIKAGALQQTLTLATAGGLELGNAADFMVQGLSAFGLKAGDAARVSAALAGGANASTASVESMGQALSQVGAQARTAGLSIEDTTAALAAFDNAGIKGSDAGTSLKTMLQRLVPSTDKASEQFKKLGLITKDGSNQFFDAKGNIKSITEVSGLLQNALKGQTKEQKLATLATMFGSDASRAAAVLAEQGAKGLAKYVKATNDKAAAENLAKSATQGYAGAMERFKGAVETAGIQAGTKLLPSVTSFVNFLSGKAIPALSKMGSDLGPAFNVVLTTVGSLGKVGVQSFKAFTSAFTGGASALKSFSNFVSTNQETILRTFLNGGQAALAFGRAIASASSVGLRGLAALIGITGSIRGAFLDMFSSLIGGAAKAFSWVPGIGPKLKFASDAFRVFAAQSKDGTEKAKRGALALADGIDNKLIPGIDAGSAAMRKFGNQEIVKARQRDQVATLNQLLKEIPKEKRAEIRTIAKKEGIDEAIAAAKKVKDKNAKINYSTNAKKAAADSNKDSAKAKDQKRNIKYDTNARGRAADASRYAAQAKSVGRNIKYDTNAKSTKDRANKDSAQAKSPKRDIKYDTNARARAADASRYAAQAKNASKDIRYDTNAARAAANATASARRAQNVTRYITYIKKGGKADGGYVDGFAGGGTVRGQGGPREDNIAGIDRTTRQQTSWVSVGEFVTNAVQTKRNREALETINAGGKWDLVPRLAAGGVTRFERPRTYERLVGASSGGRSVIHMHDNRSYSFPHLIGDSAAVVKAIKAADKTGALDGVAQDWVKRYR